MKTVVKTASKLFPNSVASFAYNKLTNPQVLKLRENELETLNKADKSILQFQGFKIQLYEWKGGEKNVLLIHGWEGQAGNFSDLIKALLKDGYTVYAFDGPSHGFSSKGKTSLFEFTELVGELIRKFKVKKLVSHSFGGVATTFALYSNPELKIENYVLLTTPDKFLERVNDVSEMVGITDRVKSMLIERIQEETGLDPSSMNVSDFVKRIKVQKSLILHDKHDKVIPISRALNVHKNWPNSGFVSVENTGHFRILRTPSVIEKVLSALNQ